jgi:hypothetical protein
MADINNKIKLINQGFFNYAITFGEEMLSEDVLAYLVKKVDFKNVPVGTIIKNYKLLSVIHKSNISSEEIINIIYYNPDSINYIQIDNFKFNTKELIGLFVAHPELIDFFNIDFNDLNFKQFLNLYSLKEDFKYKFDIKNYHQTTDDVKYGIKNFINKKYVIDILDLSKINIYEMRDLIIKYGEEYIKKIDIKKLKPLDWFEIVKKRKELFKYLDIEILKNGDGYLLAKLITIYPELDYLAEENKDVFGALAWETLIIHNPDKYYKMADIDKLRDKNWTVIIKHHPQLRPMYFA